MSDSKLWRDRSGTVDGLALRLLETGRALAPQPGAEDRAWTEFLALHGGLVGPTGGGAGTGGGTGAGGSASATGGGGSVATATGLEASGTLGKIGVSAIAKSLGAGIVLGIGAAGALQVGSHLLTSTATPSGAAPTSSVVATSTQLRGSEVRAPAPVAERERRARDAPSARAFRRGEALMVPKAGKPEGVPVTPAMTPELGSAVAEFPTDPAQTGSELGAEARELARAKTLLTRGEPAAALAVLEPSGRRYPERALAQEREALVIEGLVRSGQKAAGAARARAFFAKYPRSPLTARLRGLVSE